MISEYEARQGGFVMREVAGGYQLYSNPQWNSQIQASFFQAVDDPLIAIRVGNSCNHCLQAADYIAGDFGNSFLQCSRSDQNVAGMQLCESARTQASDRASVPIWYELANFSYISGLRDLSEMPQLQEFEELIGEKLSPEIFQQASAQEEMEAEPTESEPAVAEETDIFEPPFEEE